MALRTYKNSAWEDIADLQTPEVNGARQQAPQANAYVDSAWQEVWSATPDPIALISNGRINTNYLSTDFYIPQPDSTIVFGEVYINQSSSSYCSFRVDSEWIDTDNYDGYLGQGYVAFLPNGYDLNNGYGGVYSSSKESWFGLDVSKHKTITIYMESYFTTGFFDFSFYGYSLDGTSNVSSELTGCYGRINEANGYHTITVDISNLSTIELMQLHLQTEEETETYWIYNVIIE